MQTLETYFQYIIYFSTRNNDGIQLNLYSIVMEVLEPIPAFKLLNIISKGLIFHTIKVINLSGNINMEANPIVSNITRSRL